VHERPKKRKMSSTTKHPSPIFLMTEFVPGTVLGQFCEA
jgi:hypothetical protein